MSISRIVATSFSPFLGTAGVSASFLHTNFAIGIYGVSGVPRGSRRRLAWCHASRSGPYHFKLEIKSSFSFT